MSKSLEQSTNNEQKTLWQRVRRRIALGAAVLTFTSPCIADAEKRPGFEGPSATIVNSGAVCPTGSTQALYNEGGIGNNEIGLYAAVQEMAIFGEDNPELCFVGFSPGTQDEVGPNTSVLEQTIQTQGLTRIEMICQSYGLLSCVKQINEYFHRNPNSSVEFTLTLISSPGDESDLRPLRKFAVNALNVAPMTQELVQFVTYWSIVLQGDNNPVGGDVLENTNIAADDTPATLLAQQIKNLLQGVDKLDRRIPMFYIGDVNDQVVDTRRAVETIEQRTGQKFNEVIYMTHTDHRMENHAALWWPANNPDYKGPLTRVMNESQRISDENARIAEQVRKAMARVAHASIR